MKTLNEWFLSLPEERRKVLIEDKWMLASAAFDAGKAGIAPVVKEAIACVECGDEGGAVAHLRSILPNNSGQTAGSQPTTDSVTNK